MEQSLIRPEKIDYDKLPRKLKKKLKNRLLKTIDAAWKKGEVKIYAVLLDKWGIIKSKPDFKRYHVTDYFLG